MPAETQTTNTTTIRDGAVGVKFNYKRIRAARIYRGLSITDLANLTNTSFRYIALLETGKKMPSFLEMRRIIDELNFPQLYFFQDGDADLWEASK